MSTDEHKQEEVQEKDSDTSQEEATQPVVNEVELNVDYKDKWMRAQADYQNLQKEMADQKSEWVKWAKIRSLEEFVPVYENFKKAFAHDIKQGESLEEQQKHFDNWKIGIEYIMKQFKEIFDQNGLESIPTVGEIFDTQLHEAVSEEHSDDVAEGHIIREISGGYKVGDKVIEAAKVVVCKKEK